MSKHIFIMVLENNSAFIYEIIRIENVHK